MKKYDKDFKKETVKKYLDGQSVASISREIGVNENTIHKWKKEILSVNGEIDQEKLLMRKRIIELEMENEILNGVSQSSPEADREIRVHWKTQKPLSGEGFMPRAEIEWSSFSRLARRENLPLKWKKERIIRSGQKSFLSPSAPIRGAKDFRRIASLRFGGRTQAGGLFDERAIILTWNDC